MSGRKSTQEDSNKKRSAEDYMPDDKSLISLKHAAEHCQGCDLYRDATQTVFGEGSPKPHILFVGEQPGDSEDKAGHPFVGPAGKLLDRALESAELQRAECYFTNTVKHFKFEWRGKRRLHKTPRQIEINACLHWLREEIHTVKPRVGTVYCRLAICKIVDWYLIRVLMALRFAVNRALMHLDCFKNVVMLPQIVGVALECI